VIGKRLFDITFAGAATIVTIPFAIFAYSGIRLTSPGPVLFPARRVGKDGVPFTMPKFRTMHVANTVKSVITAPNDSRVFAFGRFLRKTKIDELPQFWAVLAGRMSIVGPRPEDPTIVEQHYVPWMQETLRVKPGITSPGALFAYIHQDIFLEPAAPHDSYVQALLPRKLALERVYVERVGFAYDMTVIARTVLTIGQMLAGSDIVKLPPEADAARCWLPADMQLLPSDRGRSAQA
jgi:lipopolysaccharide/colanic/teichoic acid biosynthesis glycosyltransferase